MTFFHFVFIKFTLSFVSHDTFTDNGVGVPTLTDEIWNSQGIKAWLRLPSPPLVLECLAQNSWQWSTITINIVNNNIYHCKWLMWFIFLFNKTHFHTWNQRKNKPWQQSTGSHGVGVKVWFLPTAHVSELRLVWWLTPVEITCMDHGETHFKSFQVWRLNTNTRERNVGSQRRAAHPHISRFVHIEFTFQLLKCAKALCEITKINALKHTECWFKQNFAFYMLWEVWGIFDHQKYTRTHVQMGSTRWVSSRIGELRCVSELNTCDCLASPFRLEVRVDILCEDTCWNRAQMNSKNSVIPNVTTHWNRRGRRTWAASRQRRLKRSRNGADVMVKELKSFSFQPTPFYLLSKHTLRMEHYHPSLTTCTIAGGWKAHTAGFWSTEVHEGGA